MTDDLANSPLPADTVGLLEGLTSTRAIRRYRDEPVPPEALRAMLFAATRAPSGSNRQPFRFIVLTDGPKAKQAKELIATGARKVWSGKRTNDGYDSGSGTVENSPKARMAATIVAAIGNDGRDLYIAHRRAVQNRRLYECRLRFHCAGG